MGGNFVKISKRRTSFGKLLKGLNSFILKLFRLQLRDLIKILEWNGTRNISLPPENMMMLIWKEIVLILPGKPDKSVFRSWFGFHLEHKISHRTKSFIPDSAKIRKFELRKFIPVTLNLNISILGEKLGGKSICIILTEQVYWKK